MLCHLALMPIWFSSVLLYLFTHVDKESIVSQQIKRNHWVLLKLWIWRVTMFALQWRCSYSAIEATLLLKLAAILDYHLLDVKRGWLGVKIPRRGEEPRLKVAWKKSKSPCHGENACWRTTRWLPENREELWLLLDVKLASVVELKVEALALKNRSCMEYYLEFKRACVATACWRLIYCLHEDRSQYSEFVEY